jgi:DNA-binding MarR family transcriptional regulator
MDDRERALDEISQLPRRIGQLSRLFVRQAKLDLPRGMASMLAALEERPHSISQLAEVEALAQPTVTRMVERLEAQELVQRERLAGNRRIVHVEITATGREALARQRARYATALRTALAEADDAELARLVDAGDALVRLAASLQRYT